MPKVERSGKRKAAPTVAGPRRKKPAKPASPRRKEPVKPVKSAKSAKSAGSSGSRSKPRPPARRARSPTRATPGGAELLEVQAVIVRYDLVCTIDSVIESNLTFGIAQLKAREHNDDNPGHDAAPIRQWR
jgi:hypothetical protein